MSAARPTARPARRPLRAVTAGDVHLALLVLHQRNDGQGTIVPELAAALRLQGFDAGVAAVSEILATAEWAESTDRERHRRGTTRSVGWIVWEPVAHSPGGDAA